MKTAYVFLLFACAFGRAAFIPDHTAEANEKTVLKMFKAFNRHQWEEVANYYGNQAHFRDPAFGTEEVIRSQKQIKARYEELHQLFPDIQNEINSLVSSGNKVVVEFISTGTAPDGSQWKLPLCTVFTVSGDKIIRDATYYDRLTN